MHSLFDFYCPVGEDFPCIIRRLSSKFNAVDDGQGARLFGSFRETLLAVLEETPLAQVTKSEISNFPLVSPLEWVDCMTALKRVLCRALSPIRMSAALGSVRRPLFTRQKQFGELLGVLDQKTPVL